MTNEDRAREIVRTYGSDKPGLAGDGSHVEVHAICLEGGIRAALDAAEVRGCRWGIEAGAELADVTAWEDAIRSLDPAAVCAERRAGK